MVPAGIDLQPGIAEALATMGAFSNHSTRNSYPLWQRRPVPAHVAKGRFKSRSNNIDSEFGILARWDAFISDIERPISVCQHLG